MTRKLHGRSGTHKVALAALLCLIVLFGSVLLVPPGSTQGLRSDDSRTWKIELVNGHPAAAHQVLVKFRPTVSTANIDSLAKNLEVSMNIPIGGAGARLLESRSKDTAQLVRELSARPDVEYAEPNYFVYGGMTPNDNRYSELWGLHNTGQNILGINGTAGADVHVESAWDLSTGARDSVVAVLDSGIDYNHPDLAANLWSAPVAYTVNISGQNITCPAGSHGWNAINRSCDPLDDHNHGTHVSGTIGAVGNDGAGVAGVNWTANIIAVKWLGSNNSGFLSNAIEAIEFAIQAKQALASVNGANVRVLNNSWWSSNLSQAVGDEIVRADAANMLFVAIAGNNGTDNDVIPRTPSSNKVPNIIGVSATDNRDQLPSFSNYGKTSVNIAAPGVNVLSTTRNGGYAYFTGTSMASPHVAGAAALLLSRCSLTTAGLKGIILTNADAVASLADKNTTGGRLNVSKAIHACVAVSNVTDDAPFFVRQHYVDFLSREPDTGGLGFWTNQITECQQPGAACDAEVRRINVSAAFFLSIEFQETGYLVERLYKSAYGETIGTSNIGFTHQLPVPVIRFNEFLPDMRQIGKDVVVGQPGWEQLLANNKAAFVLEFVSRGRFATAYPNTMTPTEFVDALYLKAGFTPAAEERTSVISEFGGAATSSDGPARARALRRVAENPTLAQQEKNKAFVLMQYFGYLRRNPNDGPDSDHSGYDFWLTKLNEFNGNFVNADMVKAFLVAGEYRQRFGP